MCLLCITHATSIVNDKVTYERKEHNWYIVVAYVWKSDATIPSSPATIVDYSWMMFSSSSTTHFEATIPSTSLRPLSRILVSLSKVGDELSFEASSSKVLLQTSLTSGHALRVKPLQSRIWNDQTQWQRIFLRIHVSRSHKHG